MITENIISELKKIELPIVLSVKSADQIVCKDKNNEIWTSSTDWNVAKSILSSKYLEGDTIIK